MSVVQQIAQAENAFEAPQTGHIAKDGREAPIDDNGVPIRRDGGAVQGAVLVFRDRTEQKQAERSLARLAAIVEFSDDAILFTDLDGIIQTWNAGADRLFGYRAEEVVGQPITLLPPERIHEEEQIQQRLLSGQRVEHLETVRVAKDGKRIDVLVTVSPVKGQDGQIIGASKIVHDITERKRAEESLREAKVAAEAASAAKSRFLANMSHELRTPMNAIVGMIDLALRKAVDPTVQDCLQTAKGSADLLLTLLTDLLDCVRIESGKLELESAPFSLRRMLDQITPAFSARAGEKGLSFRCRIPEGTPDVVVGDRSRLRQVLLNLAENAIKFTERGGVDVSVRTLLQDGDACLEFAVRDTGIGIPPSGQEDLFQPFTQADTSLERRCGGTGLGLSICRSIVELMGGRIWVESDAGKGSTFRFVVRLPLAKEPPADLEAPAVLPAAASAQLHILLVEDNPANQKLAAYILQDRGHVVEIAGDGQQAISLSQENCYDVILMDLQMPGMNGLDAAAAIRRRENGGSRVPIITMTAHAMKGDRERCLASGMDGYLSKPMNAPEMVALVERLAAALPSGAAGTIPPSPGPKQCAGLPSAAIFDPALALTRCLGKQDLLAQIIQFFFDDIDKLLPQIRSALQRRDLTEVGKLGHRLKGTITHLAAEPARDAAVRVEHLMLHGGGQAEAEDGVGTLERECQVLKEALTEYRAATAPAQHG